MQGIRIVLSSGKSVFFIYSPVFGTYSEADEQDLKKIEIATVAGMLYNGLNDTFALHEFKIR